MEKQVLEHIIHRLFARLKKYSRQLQKNLNEEAIHFFRVQVKKLRAFLRLLSVERGEKDKLKVPGRLKKMYRMLGKIRDRQLHHHRLRERLKKNRSRRPWSALYPVSGLKEEDKKLLLTSKQFTAMEKKLLAKLPNELKATAVQEFFRQKQDSIQGIIRSGSQQDEDLHSIRKNLKDIIYILQIWKEEGQALPFPFWNKMEQKKADKLSHELGLFNDACIALRFLSPAGISQAGGEEKEELKQLRQEMLAQKKKSKTRILSRLDTLLGQPSLSP